MSNKFADLDTQYIVNLIGQHTELNVILHSVTEWLESRIPDAIVSIMLYSESAHTLNLISGGQHFSSQYRQALKDLEIGPHIGSCGAAAFSRQLVICEDLSTDPNWAPFQDLIQQENLGACWSMPVLNAQGVLYGTFGTYYRHAKHPTEENIKLLRRAAALIALAIDHQHERQQRLAINEKYSSFFQHHPDAVFELDLQGYILDANLTSKTITGFALEDIQGLHYSQFLHPESQDITISAFEQAVQGTAQYFEIRAYNAAGKSYWLDLTYLPIMQNQQVIGVFSIARDISIRRRAEENLRLLKRGVDASPHGTVISDATAFDMPIVYVNPAFLTLTGYTEDEVLGKNCRFLQGPETDPVMIQAMKQAIEEQHEIKLTLKNYRKDGRWFWNQLILGPILDEQGKCTHFIGIQQDITQQQADEAYIIHQRTHDSLTNLVNRQTFEELLDLDFEIQHGSLQPLAILYIDLDDFHPLNESLGHVVGDQLIQTVATRLQEILQAGDILSRFTGDEFVMLLNKRHDQEEVTLVAESILKLLSLPFNIEGHNIHISASIGIAADHPEVTQSREILHQALQAVSEAKRQGRNTWHWPAVSSATISEMGYVDLRHELMQALEAQQFKLFYQPIVDSRSGQVKSVEALLRWQHPERGLISPAVFIPVAERTGQIVAIGQWVLQQACLDIVYWNNHHTDPLSVAVNISPLQFRRTGFLAELQQTLQNSQLAPELLKIEVTEGMLITGADRSIEILHSVRALGVQVAIDDFGTGYSSLSYLRRLPVDQIKLDRSFIEYLPQHDQDAAIVDAMITMAHTIGLEVVAEGVETEAQANFLKQKGCDALQGYYYAAAAPLADLKTAYA